jgi:8-oxo-dGTP pyrophosphatase MutT (NUDIX family)
MLRRPHLDSDPAGGHDESSCGEAMTQTTREPVPAIPSATILLLRDGSRDLEVFMVQRHHEVDFARGALVFPGGKIDESDQEAGLRERCDGAPEADDEHALRVAAIRETFEESGILLARPRSSSELVDDDRLREIEGRHRGALNRGQTTLREIVEAEDLTLACDLLVPFAHWITPEIAPKRFDTHFFLVAAPPDQAALHDGRESVDSTWTTPEAALADADAGRCTIVFPTRLNLMKLGRSHGVGEALARAREATIVTVMPRIDQTEAGPMLRIPAEADYDVLETPLATMAKVFRESR